MLAVQFRVPPPGFDIVTPWAAGLLPPAGPENVREVVDKERTGVVDPAGAKKIASTTAFGPPVGVMRSVT